MARLSAIAAARLRDVPEFGRARALVSYAPCDGEVDPSSAVAAAACEVFYPAVSGTSLEFRSIDAGLRPGWRGIPEPDGMARFEGAPGPGVILVPGVAFDDHGRRLGRGGGHYDRALAALPDAVRVGLAFELQMVGEVPVDPWDVPMHFVVTEARVIARAAGTTSDEENRA